MKVDLNELAALPERFRALEDRVAAQEHELEALRASRANDPEALLTLEQTSELTHRTLGSLQKLVQRGRLDVVRRGRSVRVRRADALALLGDGR